MVCFLVPVQQAIGDHSDEERKIQSDDDNADNLHDEVARASEWATRFHDQGATAKELLTSMSLVWKYVQKVVVVSSFDVNWPARVNGLFESTQIFSPAFDSYLGIGCVANQQTVELVMVWRWLMPAMLADLCQLTDGLHVPVEL